MPSERKSMGKVRYFDDLRGYGFVSDEDGKDVFVHRHAVKGDASKLKKGSVIEFNVETAERGTRAANVVVLR